MTCFDLLKLKGGKKDFLKCLRNVYITPTTLKSAQKSNLEKRQFSNQIVFFQEKQRLSGADNFLLLPSPMPQSQSINSISQNNSFVIRGTQSNFGHIFREQMVIPAAEKSLFSHLISPSHQTFHKICMSQTLPDHAFFTPFAFCFSLIFSFSSVRKEYNFGFNATNSVIIAPSHSSFINPIFFLFSGTIGKPFKTAG